MRISVIDDEFCVFRNGRTLTMTVIKMRTGKLVRSDTGFLGDKAVPDDIQTAIKKVEVANSIIDVKTELINKHPIKGYTPCRVTIKLWRRMLLKNEDTIVVEGKVRKIAAKSLGAGVYELSISSSSN